MSTVIEDLHFATHGPALAENFLHEHQGRFVNEHIAAYCRDRRSIESAIEAIIAYQGTRIIGMILLVPFGKDFQSSPTFFGPVLLPAYYGHAIEDELLTRGVSRMLHRFRKNMFPHIWLIRRGIDPSEYPQKNVLAFAYPHSFQEEWEVAQRVVTAHPELRSVFTALEAVLSN